MSQNRNGVWQSDYRTFFTMQWRDINKMRFQGCCRSAFLMCVLIKHCRNLPGPLEHFNEKGRKSLKLRVSVYPQKWLQWNLIIENLLRVINLYVWSWNFKQSKPRKRFLRPLDSHLTWKWNEEGQPNTLMWSVLQLHQSFKLLHRQILFILVLF